STSGRLTDGRSNSTPNFHLIDGHDQGETASSACLPTSSLPKGRHTLGQTDRHLHGDHRTRRHRHPAKFVTSSPHPYAFVANGLENEDSNRPNMVALLHPGAGTF
ncbi:MAG: hypothetical protein K2Y56_21165, partial [Methylobacterium sp.]|nr:hypothetical protein [Methylobacterium sp.]